ncbi:hypothetical protein FB567DRAFT_625833 [Paraphoma chrysanthemicola]|uniref:Uncharacterized protein n=1 Tax=Paraphoma chrysanthemicola TaxID=798071 RepID=A0A8K0REV5_9PLEO|nr:hypothetical protein FB567DRAFT_625833 [Paraphoma chrysanthemicola]
MRVPHLLVGLAGLAGMALASPTPVDGLSSAGGPGEVKLCYTVERCVTLSANNICVFIPGEIGHMVRKIYQQAGSICRYFDRNCNSEPVVEINSHAGFQYVELEGWVGNQIGYVKCLGGWHTGIEEQAGQLQARDMKPPRMYAGDVRIENWQNGGAATVWLRALDIDRLTQGPFSTCTYHKSQTSCSADNKVVTISSANFDFTPSIPQYAKLIGAVYCHQTGAPPGASIEAGPAAPRLQARDLTPGNVRGCSPDNNCQYVQPALHCKQFPSGLAKNLASILQWKHSICKYYESADCSSSLLTTATAGDQDYSVDMSWKIGERITSVYCEVQGVNADGVGETIHHVSSIEADASSTSLVTRANVWSPVDGPGRKNDSPLKVCHDINLGGKCFLYSQPPACVNNPFNVDAIESFHLDQDWRCAFYSINDCSADKGPPRYVDSKNGPITVNDVDYWISSITCMRSPFHGIDLDATPTLQARTDNTAASMIPNPTQKDEYYLLLFHDVNFGGKVFGYTGNVCANNPFNVDAIESLVLYKGWRCAFYSINDCSQDKGPPRYVDSKNGDVAIADVDYWISSITCMPSPYEPASSTHAELQARGETTCTKPGDATICDFSAFTACATIANALNTCQPVSTEYGAPASLIQYKGAVCKWYESVGCCRDNPAAKFRLVDSRNGTVSIGDTGEKAKMKSVSLDIVLEQIEGKDLMGRNEQEKNQTRRQTV